MRLIGDTVRGWNTWLWWSHARTKAYIRLDGSRILADLLGDQITVDSAGLQPSITGTPVPDDDSSPFDLGDRYGHRQLLGFVLGPLLFAVIYLWPTPEGLDPAGQAVAAVTAWVAVWWVSEAIPIPATSLLPIVAFPLTGALSVAETTPSYAHPVIFLFIGGFFLAMAMQRWNLHRRIALRTVKLMGTSPSRLILGFLLATAFLSMWVSNTATVMMMVPIAMAVLYQATDLMDSVDDVQTAVREGQFQFGLALMLAIAYGASVGGVATLIGSPPNIIFAGQVNELFGETVTFLQWMYYGVPIAVIGLVAVFIYVTRIAVKPDFNHLPMASDMVDEQLKELGNMSRPERRILAVFVGMATGWIGVSLLTQFNVVPVPANADAIVAIAGGLVLFMYPTRTVTGERTFLLDWSHAVQIPWGVILLFGGGLAIASGFAETGLATWIGLQLSGLGEVSLFTLLFVIVVLTIFLTEITSNTATTAMLLPVVAGLAIGIGVHPYVLMIAAATAASFAFMLPVATPPNAIVFGSGYVTLPQMARVGVGLNLLGVLLVTLIAYYWLPIAWGIDLEILPELLFN